MYSKQNRSLRCVYTEIGRNIFYRFFVGLLWNTNGSEETHPPLSLAARKGVLWLCFGLLRLLYQPRVALYEFLIPLVLAHRLQKVFPMPMCHRSTVVCWFWERRRGGKSGVSEGCPFLFRRNTLGVSPTRLVPVAHDNGESDARGLHESNLVLEEGVQIVRTYLWLPVDDVVADILQAGHRAEGADDDDEGRGGLVRHRDAILRALQTLPHTPLNTPPGCSLIWFQNLQTNVSHEILRGSQQREEREGGY